LSKANQLHKAGTGRVVIAPNEFWLHLHLLAEAYAAEGTSAEARAANIVAQLENMPRPTQRVLLADLVQLVTHCPDLYSLAVEAVSDGKAPQPQRSA
jgi:hypothetical protein